MLSKQKRFLFENDFRSSLVGYQGESNERRKSSSSVDVSLCQRREDLRVELFPSMVWGQARV